jgi:SsrA-binding protein
MTAKEQPKRIVNKKAYHYYHILDTLTAGIQLYGTDVKLVREGRVGITEAYAAFMNDELYLNNLHLAEHAFGRAVTQTSKTQRKLLLKRRELNRWQSRIVEKGISIVPLSLYFSDNGWLKAELALVKGKREYDKRQTLKTDEAKRELSRISKQFGTKY